MVTAAGNSSSVGGVLGSLISVGDGASKGLLSAGLQGMANLIPSAKEAAVCQILDGLMEQKPGSAADSYLYLDPKAPPVPASSEAPRLRAPFQRAVVFVVGGGNCSE